MPEAVPDHAAHLDGHSQSEGAAELFELHRQILSEPDVGPPPCGADEGLDCAPGPEIKHRNLLLKEIRLDGNSLRLAPPELRSDRFVVLTAVRQDARAVRFSAPEVRADRRFMLAIAKLDGASALRYAAPELRSDRDVAWAAVLQSREALRYVAPEDLRRWCAEAGPDEHSRLLGAVLGVGAGAAKADSCGLVEEVDACAEAPRPAPAATPSAPARAAEPPRSSLRHLGREEPPAPRAGRPAAADPRGARPPPQATRPAKAVPRDGRRRGGQSASRRPPECCGAAEEAGARRGGAAAGCRVGARPGPRVVEEGRRCPQHPRQPHPPKAPRGQRGERQRPGSPGGRLQAWQRHSCLPSLEPEGPTEAAEQQAWRLLRMRREQGRGAGAPADVLRGCATPPRDTAADRGAAPAGGGPPGAADAGDPAPEPLEGRRVVVEGAVKGLTVEQITRRFEEFGEVERVVCGFLRDVVFVLFRSRRGAQAACRSQKRKVTMGDLALAVRHANEHVFFQACKVHNVGPSFPLPAAAPTPAAGPSEPERAPQPPAPSAESGPAPLAAGSHSEPEVHAVVPCPDGHPLRSWRSTGVGECDGCGCGVAAGQQVMDCRACNWYLCPVCFQEALARCGLPGGEGPRGPAAPESPSARPRMLPEDDRQDVPSKLPPTRCAPGAAVPARPAWQPGCAVVDLASGDESGEHGDGSEDGLWDSPWTVQGPVAAAGARAGAEFYDLSTPVPSPVLGPVAAPAMAFLYQPVF